MTAILIGVALGGCSVGRLDALSPTNNGGADSGNDVTGSIAPSPAGIGGDQPTAADLAFARLAVSDVLTRGDKDSSQPWENPATGARGSVTPLASAYSTEGRTCRDFLASYVNGTSESWLHGAACRAEGGPWEIRRLKPWKQS
ncbi:MAG: RT0821/Lpp0805 family surface protein [Xanthobacteraceae bacterium]|nr:RT0821/Lpp0805 family surface protein [Xanthobacteraceae bacterium]